MHACMYVQVDNVAYHHAIPHALQADFELNHRVTLEEQNVLQLEKVKLIYLLGTPTAILAQLIYNQQFANESIFFALFAPFVVLAIECAVGVHGGERDDLVAGNGGRLCKRFMGFVRVGMRRFVAAFLIFVVYAFSSGFHSWRRILLDFA